MTKLGQEWAGRAAHDDSYVVDGENVVALVRDAAAA